MTGVRSAFSSRDALLLALLAALWGNSFLFIKVAVAWVPPAWIVTFRMAVGGLLLLGIAAAKREGMPRNLRTLGILAFIGVVGCAAPWVGQGWAQRLLDSGLVAVLNSTTPIATLLMSVIAGHERLHRRRILGLVVAISGTLIVIGGEIGSGNSPVALVVAVLATFGYALGGVLTHAHVSGRVANVPAAATQLTLGGMALGPWAWAFNGPPPTAVSPVVLAALCALGVLGTGIAFLLYFTLIQNVGATNASMVTYIIPVVGLASGAIFRGERFGANVFVGAAALIGGVWLAQRERARDPGVEGSRS
jgi:drug/metabolite transporter (DMT)-like permease